MHGTASASVGLGKSGHSSTSPGNRMCCWPGAGRALLILIRCHGEMLSGIEIAANKARGNNSVFRVTYGALDSFFSFNSHLTDHCVQGSVLTSPHSFKQSWEMNIITSTSPAWKPKLREVMSIVTELGH